MANLIRLGERVGNYRVILPLCRRSLTNPTSRVRSSINSMLLVPMIVAAIVVLFVAIVIVPKFREIQAVLMEGSAPEEIQRLRVGLSNFGTEDMTTLPSDATLATWAVGLIVVFV